MREGWAKDFVFVLYMLGTGVFAFIYFSIPERAEFLANAIGWWEELIKIVF